MCVRTRRRIDYRNVCAAAFFRALLGARDYFLQARNLLFFGFAGNWPGINDARIGRATIQTSVWFSGCFWSGGGRGGHRFVSDAGRLGCRR